MYSGGRQRALCAWAIAALWAAPVHAGWQIDYRVAGERDLSGPGRGVIEIAGPRLRIEAPDGRRTALFDAETQRLWLLDASEETWVRIDRDELDDITRELARAAERRAAQLARLPPEQRAALERLLPRADGDARAPDAAARTGETREIAGRRCQVSALHRGPRRLGDACVVPWHELSLRRSDFRVLRDFGAFQAALLAGAAGLLPSGLRERPFQVFDQLGGLPLELRSLDEERVRDRTLLSLPVERDIPRERFEPPPGWLQRSVWLDQSAGAP